MGARVRAALAVALAAATACDRSPSSPDGACPFAYDPPRASAEAEQIGLEMLGAQGPLRLPGPVYERVLRDLALVRAAWPVLADQEHLGRWVPDQIVVGLAGGCAIGDLAPTNACYQAEPSHLFAEWYVLGLPGKLNAPALAAVYGALACVWSAFEDGIVGQENFWTPEDRGGGTWRWTVDDGFYDCFDGCDCHTFYRFDVDGAGAVTLVDTWREGQPWCVFP